MINGLLTQTNTQKMLSREQLSDDLEYVKTKIKDFID